MGLPRCCREDPALGRLRRLVRQPIPRLRQVLGVHQEEQKAEEVGFAVSSGPEKGCKEVLNDYIVLILVIYVSIFIIYSNHHD